MTLVTPSDRSRRPRTSMAGAVRATLRWAVQQPFDTTTLMRPVSSSRFTKSVPPAVAGRWRWVTTPPTSTRVARLDGGQPGGGDDAQAVEVLPDEAGGVALGADAGGPQVGPGLLVAGHGRQIGAPTPR